MVYIPYDDKEEFELTGKNDILEDKTMTSKELEQSFYTTSNSIVNRDFEDVEEGMNIFLKRRIFSLPVTESFLRTRSEEMLSFDLKTVKNM